MIENTINQNLSYDQKFKDDGLLIIDDLISDSELNSVSERFNEIFNSSNFAFRDQEGLSVIKKNVSYINNPLAISPELVKFTINKNINQILENYVNEEVCLAYAVAYRTKELNDDEKFFYNSPGVFSGWHSDTAVKARGHKSFSVMLYLNEVNEDNGPLEVVIGSNSYGGKKRVWLDEEIEKSKIKKVIGKKGTTSIFDMDGIHRAGMPKHGFRDVFRANFVPINGYKEVTYFSNFSLPNDLDNKSKNILQIGFKKFKQKDINNNNPAIILFKEFFSKETFYKIVIKIPFFAKFLYKVRENKLRSKAQ